MVKYNILAADYSLLKGDDPIMAQPVTYEVDHDTRIYHDYYDLLRDVVIDGNPFGGTRELLNVAYVIPIHENMYERPIVFPRQRAHKEFSVSYMLKELYWYSTGNTSADTAGNMLAPLWRNMADENGNVQSNYGYQLSVNEPWLFDDDECNARLIPDDGEPVKYASLNIGNAYNSSIHSDTICNTRVDVCVERDTDEYDHTMYHVRLRVVSRSLDIIFGLPYDMCFFQALGHWIAERLSCITENSAALAGLMFHTMSIHMYDKHVAEYCAYVNESVSSFGKREGYSYVSYSDTAMCYWNNYTRLESVTSESIGHDACINVRSEHELQGQQDESWCTQYDAFYNEFRQDMYMTRILSLDDVLNSTPSAAYKDDIKERPHAVHDAHAHIYMAAKNDNIAERPYKQSRKAVHADSNGVAFVHLCDPERASMYAHHDAANQYYCMYFRSLNKLQ